MYTLCSQSNRGAVYKLTFDESEAGSGWQELNRSGLPGLWNQKLRNANAI